MHHLPSFALWEMSEPPQAEGEMSRGWESAVSSAAALDP